MKFLREIVAFAIVVAALFVSGCDNGSELSNAKTQNKAVTYYTIDGIWKLVEWNNIPIAEGTHLYVDLDRKSHNFEMWDNLNSMYTTMRSGSFLLSVDDMGRSVISGWYDYGVGDWSDEYIVELTSAGDMMSWRSVSNGETMTFVEVDELPEF